VGPIVVCMGDVGEKHALSKGGAMSPGLNRPKYPPAALEGQVESDFATVANFAASFLMSRSFKVDSFSQRI